MHNEIRTDVQSCQHGANRSLSHPQVDCAILIPHYVTVVFDCPPQVLQSISRPSRHVFLSTLCLGLQHRRSPIPRELGRPPDHRSPGPGLGRGSHARIRSLPGDHPPAGISGPGAGLAGLAEQYPVGEPEARLRHMVTTQSEI